MISNSSKARNRDFKKSLKINFWSLKKFYSKNLFIKPILANSNLKQYKL